ncbi:hypothetical protein [Streptomyces sp. NPDC059262]|uniref:hypothetical protein n=1 Tax=Streptomyces sp. NPDC059262 TaxID=3346797 RepID=UPI0036BD13D1
MTRATRSARTPTPTPASPGSPPRAPASNSPSPRNTLAGSAGIGTHLLRLPHTSTTANLGDAQWEAARDAITDGYVVVASDGPERGLKDGFVRQFTGSAAAVRYTERIFASPLGGVRFTTVGNGLGLSGATYPVSPGSPRRAAPPSSGHRPRRAASPT